MGDCVNCGMVLQWAGIQNPSKPDFAPIKYWIYLLIAEKYRNSLFTHLKINIVKKIYIKMNPEVDIRCTSISYYTKNIGPTNHVFQI